MKEEKLNGKVTELSTNPNTKPTPLIGSTEVYQKDGLPYWYCRIKNGRDEFMYLYFGDLTNDDVLYTADGKTREFVTEWQKKFKSYVMKALENKPEEGFRWIPVHEPSMDDNGNLQYIAGKNTLRNRLNSYNWEEILQKYSPENESRMATITTHFLLLLRFLKDGYATLEQLTDGCFWDCKGGEKTGERQLGGSYIFSDNTVKMVKDSESGSGFSLIGSGFQLFCFYYPLTYVDHVSRPEIAKNNCVGLIELIK